MRAQAQSCSSPARRASSRMRAASLGGLLVFLLVDELLDGVAGGFATVLVGCGDGCLLPGQPRESEARAVAYDREKPRGQDDGQDRERREGRAELREILSHFGFLTVHAFLPAARPPSMS